jgi:PAS domain S-box-containing protein
MPATSTTNPRILLVDDDRAVLQTYLRALRQHAPLLAEDGLAARKILSETPVDVVVCDLEMPRMNGLDLMRWARDNCPHPEWIVVSGQGTLDAAIAALKLGAFDFICKPIQSALQLQTVVANAARHKELVTEVTERRVMEVAIRESERQLRQLVENLPELAWSARADGYIDFYNRRWYEYTGTTFAEVEGWGWQAVHSPELVDQVVENWTRSLETGAPFEMEFPLRGADGTFRWFLTRVSPLRNGDARIARWFGTSTDIDDARRARAEREQLVIDLRQAVELRDEFLSIASHELRTPLTALQLQLQGTAHLLERLNNPINTKFLTKLEVANRQTNHLATLVNGLLDVARSSLGRLTLEPDDVDLVDLTHEVIERYTPEAHNAGCTIQLDADPEVRGLWDRARMEQVVTNLVTNSIKYGSGRPIEVRVTSADGWAHLVVRDHGIGIPPADLERVFARFERAVPSKHYGGLGLGLYITRQIVEAHGGTIEVSSEVGHGATFTVKVRLRPDLHRHAGHQAVNQVSV